MTPERFAQEFEKARYESMLSRRWADLRDAERQTRTTMALAALAAAGLTAVLEAADETALRAEVFEGLVGQRDAEIARIRAEHAADLDAAREQHAAELARAHERHAAELAGMAQRHAAQLAEERGAPDRIRPAAAVA